MSDAFSELYIADRSGKDLQKLTNDEPADEPYTEDFAFNAAWAVDPDWSPVSDQIVFISDKGGLDPYSDIMSLWFAERWDVRPIPYPLDAAQGIDHMQLRPQFLARRQPDRVRRARADQRHGAQHASLGDGPERRRVPHAGGWFAGRRL